MNNNGQAHCDEDKEPLVSAIIPTYKRSKLVTRAIRSVLNQTVQDIEIIVVDDASPDDTETAVLSVGSSRVRYIRHDNNRGLPASRNTGIHAARGKFIAFLDDDDEWLPEKTTKQLRFLEEYRLDAAVSMCLIDGSVPLGHHSPVLLMPDDLRKGNKWGSCSLIAKANVIRAIMFDETLSIGEDWDFYIRLAQAYRLGCLNEPLFIYHQVGQHAAPQRMISSAKELSPQGLERVAMLHKHRTFFGERQFKHLMARALLSYIGRRRNPLPYIRYSVSRCGIVPVMSVLSGRVAWHLWRIVCGLRHRLSGMFVTRPGIGAARR